MIRSVELRKGTVLEATQACLLYPDRGSLLEHLGAAPNVAAGQMLEVAKVTSSPIWAHLSEVGGGVKDRTFLVWMQDAFKIASQPEGTSSYAEDEPHLNDNEEFALVRKSNPAQPLRAIQNSWTKPGKSDIPSDNLIFTSRSGQRRTIKNMQALTGFLHSCSGMLDQDIWWKRSQADGSKSREYHMHALENLPEWAVGKACDQHFDQLELRKYNRDARTTSNVAVDFDILAHLAKFKAVFELTYLHGEAVSGLAAKLAEEGALDKLPFVFATEFDTSAKDFPMARMAPREKDLSMDLAIKAIGLKKRDVPCVNKNGFAAAACATKEQAEALKAAYKDASKSAAILAWADMETAPISGYYASAFPAAPAAKAAKP